MSQLQPKLYGLDHLRALAILLVFLFHYQILSKGQPTWLPDVAKFGWTGVDLFFVLSGFLISSQLFAQIREGRRISFRTFFLKRFFRILPAFWVVLLLYFCVPMFREKEALPSLWRFLTFTQNFGLNIKYFGTFSHAWSLCVEEHFYLLLPIVLIALQWTGWFKKAGWLLIALFLFGFAIRIYSYNHLYVPKLEAEYSWAYWYKFVYYPTYNRLDGLLAGVSLAAVYRFLPLTWNRIAAYGNWLIVLSLLVLTGAWFICYDEHSYAATVFGFPLVALGYGLLVAGAVSPNSFLYRWKSRVTTLIATLSYAVYLTHKGIVHVTHELFAGTNIDPNLLLVISIVCCIAAAWLLHLLIEKPFMRLRDRLLHHSS